MSSSLSEASPKQLLDILEKIADEMDKTKDAYGEATGVVDKYDSEVYKSAFNKAYQKARVDDKVAVKDAETSAWLAAFKELKVLIGLKADAEKARREYEKKENRWVTIRKAISLRENEMKVFGSGQRAGKVSY